MTQQILHIPGLGDGGKTLPIINRWANASRTITHFDTKWSSDESYDKKYHRLKLCYTKLAAKGQVTVVAVSAGGSLATRLAADYEDIQTLHFVSTKSSGSTRIGSPFQKRAPALLPAVQASEQALQQVHLFENKSYVYRPLFDEIVPLQDMLIGNAQKIRLPIIGHALGIGLSLLVFVPRKL